MVDEMVGCLAVLRVEWTAVLMVFYLAALMALEKVVWTVAQ